MLGSNLGRDTENYNSVFCVIFLSSSSKLPVRYLKLGNGHFLPTLFQILFFIILTSYAISSALIAWALNKPQVRNLCT